MKPRALAAALGKQLQAFREDRTLRQDDVARAARRAGLPWTRVVVRALETGRRELSIDEFSRLPIVLQHLSGGDARPARLESDAATARLEVEPLALISQVLASENLEKRRYWDTEWARLRNVLGPGRMSGAHHGTWEAIAENQAIYMAAGGDLEQKIARRARLDPFLVASIAHGIWGHSLTEERDRRIAEQAPSGTPPRALRALRGHVTRALRKELDPRLAEARTQLRRKKGARR